MMERAKKDGIVKEGILGNTISIMVSSNHFPSHIGMKTKSFVVWVRKGELYMTGI